MVIYGSPFQGVEIPHVTLHDTVLKDFEKFPREAFIDAVTKQCYTYPQIKKYSYSFGSALVRYGLKKGDIVIIYTPNGIHYPVIVLGTLSVGGIISTANPLYTEAELVHQLKDSKPKFIVCTTNNLRTAETSMRNIGLTTTFITVGNSHTSKCLKYENLINDDGKAFPKNLVWNVQDDVALIFYSSGTTGLPKGVMLTHYNMVAAITGYRSIIPAASDEDVQSYNIGIQPLFHLGGFISVIGLNQIRKNTTVIFPRFNLEQYLQAVEKYKPFMISLPPAALLYLVKSPLVKKYDLSSVQLIIMSTAKATAELEEMAKEKLNISFAKQAYGMTETTAYGTFSPLTTERAGSVGYLSPNVYMKIIDTDTGKSLVPGKLGEICIRGPVVMKGYINNPKATEEIIDEDGWIHTGDIGYITEDGFVFIEDRIKELIKYKGYQVAPAELEGILITHPDVQDVAVIGIPDAAAGELPKAYVVRKNLHLSEKELIDFVAGKVVPQKYLRGGVEFIQEIPKTSSGKIMRRSLRQFVAEHTKSKL